MREIESRFLVNELPYNYSSYPMINIEQGYFGDSCNFTQDLRVRKETNGDGVKYFLTEKKYIKAPYQRQETNKVLTEQEFFSYWKQTHDARLSKKRYLIPYRQYKIELNIYNGKLTGLLVAEIEFESEEHRKYFVPPLWFGRDITGLKEFENRSLACHGLPKEKGVI